MKKIIFIVFIILISLLVLLVYIFQFFIYSNLSEKEQAREFALKVVETYFTKDCAVFYNALDDTIYTLEDEGPFTKSDLKNIGVCSKLSKQTVKGEHSFQDYIDSYDIRVLNNSEYEVEFPQFKNFQKFNLTQRDYLFTGSEVKEGKENFMWTDPLSFVVKKRDNNWAFWKGSWSVSVFTG